MLFPERIATPPPAKVKDVLGPAWPILPAKLVGAVPTTFKVVATDWQALDQAKRAGVQYKVNFVYPKDEAFPEATGQAADYPGQSTKLEAGRSYNFNYSFATRSKAPWMVPVSVYDDGRFTYVEMPDLTQFPTGNFPAVYGREKRRGEDFVVNTTVEKNTIVVHGTYNYLVIRHGENAVGLRRNPQQ